MYLVFLLNAFVLVYLGAFIALNDRRLIAKVFLSISLAFAVWGVCVFYSRFYPDVIHPNIIEKLKIISSLVFFTGFLYFSYLYPDLKLPKKINLNLIIVAGFAITSTFTNWITEAEIVNNTIVYRDGVGWNIYTVYGLFLIFASTRRLLKTAREKPDYRERIRILLIGMVVFVSITMLFNTVLPALGYQQFLALGYLSISLPPYFIAYAVAKQQLLDANLLINRNVAWAITIALIIFSYVLAIINFRDQSLLYPIMVFLAVFWALTAYRCQEFLLTSARRKFIRNWYEPDDVISEIAEQLTVEKDREAIFTILVRVLDDVFQLERSTLILAIRNQDEQISHYEATTHSTGKQENFRLEDTTLVDEFQFQKKPDYLDNCSEAARKYLRDEGFKLNKHCLVVPFYSPEFLEGIVVMGERSSQSAFTERDLRFMMRLVNYIAAILYRLTPFEKLEKLYFESRERLHEAEIQLIRAQKIEAIVHATRQCHHEIRTPLNIIKLGIGRINTMDDLKSYKKYADEEVSRALEIVEETLTITDVTKAEEDRTTRFDMNDVVKRSIRVVDLERYDLELDFENLPEINGTFSDMQVVISNLIHNALDAMPDGGRLAIRTYPRDKSVIIEVEDSGGGIEESLRSRVWEPYFSGKETEVGNSTAGRGWGLTIVNRIITEHKGTINFISEVGVGTTFTITLPAA